jgi:hypothetical protein
MNIQNIAADVLRSKVALTSNKHFADTEVSTFRTVDLWPQLEIAIVNKSGSILVCNDLPSIVNCVVEQAKLLDKNQLFEFIKMVLPYYCRLLNEKYLEHVPDIEAKWDLPECTENELTIFILEGRNGVVLKWHIIGDAFDQQVIGNGPQIRIL